MSIIMSIVYFALSCVGLMISGIFLVKSLSHIARFLGISEFSAAFIIMAFASSIPELFVGITSALSGNPDLSLGNVIGANIIDLTLISGIIILVSKEIKIESKRIGSDVYFMLISILLLIILYTLGNSLSRIDGFLLIIIFGLHSYKEFKKRKKYKQKMKGSNQEKKKFKWLLVFILALVGLFIFSNFAVTSAIKLASDINFPRILIGLFILSIATTLPELVFGISATNLKHKEMAIGDQIGSVVTNTALILGLVAIIHPISSDTASLLTSGIFMFISAFIFVTFLKTGKKLEKIEGISLILIYILFIMIEFFIR
jgi:cation:H+ antiporter